MRTILTAALLIVLPCGLRAGEPTKQTTKEKRIVQLTNSIKETQGLIVAYAGKEGDEVFRKRVAALPAKEAELAYLKGELTVKIAEEKIKAAAEALKKAEEAKDQPATDKAKAELEAAAKRLELVKGFEAKGEF